MCAGSLDPTRNAMKHAMSMYAEGKKKPPKPPAIASAPDATDEALRDLQRRSIVGAGVGSTRASHFVGGPEAPDAIGIRRAMLGGRR